jgi:hypothetical protein
MIAATLRETAAPKCDREKHNPHSFPFALSLGPNPLTTEPHFQFLELSRKAIGLRRHAHGNSPREGRLCTGEARRDEARQQGMRTQGHGRTELGDRGGSGQYIVSFRQLRTCRRMGSCRQCAIKRLPHCNKVTASPCPGKGVALSESCQRDVPKSSFVTAAMVPSAGK